VTLDILNEELTLNSVRPSKTIAVGDRNRKAWGILDLTFPSLL
jgi:hypothetical protein